ncbi:hypothetical protein DFW21_12995, partial [Clostridioides difficile]|nr:hypothetical protein [Clostridioides difficile]
MKYVASFSGGKDSAAMLLLILEKRLLLDEIVFGTTVHDLEKRFRNEDIENERQISFFQTEKV